MNKVLAKGFLVAVAIGGLYLYFKPTVIPDVVFKDHDGGQIALSEMHGEKENLLVVFFLPGCPYSALSLKETAALYEAHGTNTEFVGLFFGNAPAAKSFKDEHELPFEVYGLRATTDPLLINGLIEQATSSLGQAKIWGGTVLILDKDLKMDARLEKEEVRDLAATLEELS